MASGRFVRTSISENETLAELGVEAALLFTWLIPHLDRDGRMNGHPQVIAGKVVPLFPDLARRVEDLLGDLACAGLIRWYEVSGKLVVALPKFADHQKGLRYEKEAESRYPGVDQPGLRDVIGNGKGDAPPADEVRTLAVPAPPEEKRREEKRTEERGMEENDPLALLHPDAIAVLSSFEKRRSVEALIRTRFLSPDGMPHEAVKGLREVDRIAALVSAALVEYAAQADGHFNAALFAGYVKRLRNAPRQGTQADQVRGVESVQFRPLITERSGSLDRVSMVLEEGAA